MLFAVIEPVIPLAGTEVAMIAPDPVVDSVVPFPTWYVPPEANGASATRAEKLVELDPAHDPQVPCVSPAPVEIKHWLAPLAVGNPHDAPVFVLQDSLPFVSSQK